MRLAPALARVAYATAEVLTRGQGVERVIDGERVRLPARWARFFPRRYDPGKREFLRRHCLPGSLAIDAGAHIGLYSVIMARAVGATGRVISLEPTPLTASILTRTIALNGLEDRVTVLQQAVAQEPGRTSFTVNPGPSNANTLVGAPPPEASISVDVTTLDVVLRDETRRVSCIKLDVEGAELRALRGAARTIERYRPALAIEVHPALMNVGGESVTDLLALLGGAGYTTSGSELESSDRAGGGVGPFELQALHIDAAKTDR